MATNGSGKHGEKESNMDVDYVLSFRFAGTGESSPSYEGARICSLISNRERRSGSAV